MNSEQLRCECPVQGRINPMMRAWYDEETELPFVDHEPNECKCSNDLARYRCSDGVTRVLCSCCNCTGDARLEGGAS